MGRGSETPSTCACAQAGGDGISPSRRTARLDTIVTARLTDDSLKRKVDHLFGQKLSDEFAPTVKKFAQEEINMVVGEVDTRLTREMGYLYVQIARAIYDRLGLPVSRLIRGPWAADGVYLLMKPFEWLFALSLLLLDRTDPEQRIDRMYRRR